MQKKLPNFKLTPIAQGINALCRQYWRAAFIRRQQEKKFRHGDLYSTGAKDFEVYKDTVIATS
jgi:hypothetical protein